MLGSVDKYNHLNIIKIMIKIMPLYIRNFTGRYECITWLEKMRTPLKTSHVRFSRQNQTERESIEYSCRKMEFEQTTLNQYFTTRRKGLEGVHPAKRRKVDAKDLFSENAGMRTRSKTRKQASMSQTKASRSGKATNRFVMKSGNEVSFQPSCDSGETAVSQPTSLLDDHAFAEALFGKLEAANRKRKMASLGQTDDSVEHVRDKGSTVGAERQKEKIGVIDLTEANATTRRKAKGTKPSWKELKETRQDLRKTTEGIHNSSNSDVESATQHEKTLSSTNEVTASPQKTPPVVRRIVSGVKTNPWIAEQARAVLSRGKTAVNLSQNTKNKSREKQQAKVKKSGMSSEKKVKFCINFITRQSPQFLKFNFPYYLL